MNTTQMPLGQIDFYIERAKNRYLEKFVYSDRRLLNHLFFMILFVGTGLLEGYWTMRWADDHRINLGFEWGWILLPALLQGGLYYAIYRRSRNRENRKANEPSKILWMVQEILEEDRPSGIQIYQGAYQILLQFRNSELNRLLERSDVESIDQTIEILRQFSVRMTAEEANIRQKLIQSIEKRLQHPV